MPRELPKAYEPAAIEDRWAEYWVEEGLFHQPSPEAPPPAPLFTTLLPPPNVTGRLHMGHMLNQTEIDILTRWRRMSGALALWIPGTDHAGIATQMMVERQLDAEGKSRQQLGREAFIERVWEWKRHYGGAILEQMKRLGVSVDWSREYFTMDASLSAAVREAFVRLHEQGLIYRGAYIVNWCPRCQTAISDLEVVHEEQKGKLWEIRYPLADGSGAITVATTRPETMLGDVAVAVNPEDERYAGMESRLLRLPLAGREIPVIADDWVSLDFGTGAVKVTPAHDPNDFALGERHGLMPIQVMDETAHMNAAAGAYAGLDRFAARKKVLEDLEKQGLLVAVREHVHAVGKCDRCKTVVEPRLSTQWFIAVNKQPKRGGLSMAEAAIAAVNPDARGEKAISFTPAMYEKTYLEWMNNIHDWCISRQLWWGHRIPAWHCRACQHITVARSAPASCEICGSSALEQETDVLDTWFSSGLLPLSVFGWPARTPDLAAFYPTQLLVTGFDILFFWVARMIMLGCHFMADAPEAGGGPRPLKDTVPFREVYIHALVRDAERQKMSKTKGNVIDPIEIVRRFGTDAVRFTLAAMASPGTDIAFSEERTSGYRAFANKIWNATRFIFLQMERAAEAGIELDLVRALAEPATGAAAAPLETRWIRARFENVAAEVNEVLGEYRFHEAANLVYQFFWGDFCDWYLEIVKLRLDFSPGAKRAEAQAALAALVGVFEGALRLLSPFMPFLTEELWHALYDGKPPARSIAFTRYPVGYKHEAGEGEGEMAILQELIVTLRGIRKDLGVEEGLAAPAEISRFRVPTGWLPIVERLARISKLAPVEAVAEGAGSRSTPHFDVAVLYERKIEVAAECARLAKDLARMEKESSNAARQLANASFLEKAPEAVVHGLRSRAAELSLLIPKTRAAMESLGCEKSG